MSKHHAFNCPGLQAWDIPEACNCSGRGYEVKTTCRCCGESDLMKYLDFGEQPLANEYRTNKKPQATYPLAVNVCKNCYHSQLSVVVDPDLMFKEYAYVSGTTQTLKNFFQDNARSHNSWWVDTPSPKVLDIACNDGSQLDAFKALGWRTYGVDPAENITPIAQRKGHIVANAYWDIDIAHELLEMSEGPMDVILAQNVFAHTDDILGFLTACKILMHKKTVLHIMTSQRDMIINGEFDTVYHEHLSFFNVRSMKAIAKRAGLYLNELHFAHVHGGSYIFELGLVENEYAGNVLSGLGARIAEEEAMGLYDLETYRKFGLKADAILQALHVEIQRWKRAGYHAVGYGAAAKGMTVLNAVNLDIDYIVDENPLKIGKLTPGRNIEIVEPGVMADDADGLVIVVFAWNFLDEIKAKVKTMRPYHNDVFITYFPQISVSK